MRIDDIISVLDLCLNRRGICCIFQYIMIYDAYTQDLCFIYYGFEQI